jgi:hypothetical protein
MVMMFHARILKSFRRRQATQIVQNRTIGSRIAVTVGGQFRECSPHGLKLLDLVIKFRNVFQREAFHLFAGAALVAPQAEQISDLVR